MLALLNIISYNWEALWGQTRGLLRVEMVFHEVRARQYSISTQQESCKSAVTRCQDHSYRMSSGAYRTPFLHLLYTLLRIQSNQTFCSVTKDFLGLYDCKKSFDLASRIASSPCSTSCRSKIHHHSTSIVYSMKLARLRNVNHASPRNRKKPRASQPNDSYTARSTESGTPTASRNL